MPKARVPNPLDIRFGQFSGSRQVADSDNIRVIRSPDNLVLDMDSRFREGGITGEQEALIDHTRCTEDGLAPTTLTGKEGTANSASGVLYNDIRWVSQTKNTFTWPEKGAEWGAATLRHGLCGTPEFLISDLRAA